MMNINGSTKIKTLEDYVYAIAASEDPSISEDEFIEIYESLSPSDSKRFKGVADRLKEKLISSVAYETRCVIENISTEPYQVMCYIEAFPIEKIYRLRDSMSRALRNDKDMDHLIYKIIEACADINDWIDHYNHV